MARKQIIISLAVFIPILVLIALMTAEMGKPPDYEQALNDYLAHASVGSGFRWHVENIEKAGKASNLPRMSGIVTYGDNPYFRTDVTFEQGRERASLRTLPYPPGKLWCATLEANGSAEPAFILIGKHVDLYNATFVVHRPDLGHEALEELMALVGCPDALALLQRSS